MSNSLESTTRQPVTCRHFLESSPWLLAGSLEEDETAALLEHVGSCERCAAELEATASVFALATTHLPSRAVAEYAHGLEPSELSRECVEEHLAICPSCRAEVEMATPGRVLDFATAREAQNAPAAEDRGAETRTWRRLAIAAGTAALFASSAWIAEITPRSGETTSTPGSPPIVADRADLPAAGAIDPRPAGAFFADGFESGDTRLWASSARTSDFESQPSPSRASEQGNETEI